LPQTSQICTLHLHDALPISYFAANLVDIHTEEFFRRLQQPLYTLDVHMGGIGSGLVEVFLALADRLPDDGISRIFTVSDDHFIRSEEHTSELQSRENIVFRL